MIDTTFLDELASKAPTPGGGGAAAYAGALAAALGSMVCNLTVGKKKYAEVESEMRAALEKLEQVRAQLVGLIDADAEAFSPLAAAYGMPKATPEEQAAKDEALQAALVGACDVPIDIMRAVAEAAEAIEFVAHNGSRLAVSDAGVAAAFAKAAVQGASFNVYINAASMSDAGRAAAYRAQADGIIAEVVARCDAVYDYVMGEVR